MTTSNIEDTISEVPIEYMIERAKKGDSYWQYELGLYYYEGPFDIRNNGAAYYWFMRAAKQGNTLAQLSVADCFFFGIGVKCDLKAAVAWYKIAASHDDDKDPLDEQWAASRVGLCYLRGYGVEKDLEKSAEWYEKAGWHEKAEEIRLYGEDSPLSSFHGCEIID